MNAHRIRRSIVAIAAAAVLPLAVTACSSDSSDTAATEATAPVNNEQDTTPEPTEDATQADAPFGTACADVPEEGDGSFDGMAEDPVATAASNNPELSTLVDAVDQADLVDTLNNSEDITVFAPTNDAFDKLPEDDLKALLADKDELTKVLTYHVVGERLAPSDLEDGEFETLETSKLTTSGSDEEYQVNDESNIVCGNVQTSNATVYIVDTVLMPKS
ncbi:fasciclin domain-containing protein [Streptomyces sp. 549]|uniref:fasciclin domain-containing protein n=1 Tax=Streptomyces sp. 549 TaxID=3049076 RepID=UPI0024C23465|nr:fasciclin domain-containing protein [Streptomyces sp. 549]MDK1472109.1 fasciclin domain-containing protein [Streptomyces sp. 549]